MFSKFHCLFGLFVLNTKFDFVTLASKLWSLWPSLSSARIIGVYSYMYSNFFFSKWCPFRCGEQTKCFRTTFIICWWIFCKKKSMRYRISKWYPILAVNIYDTASVCQAHSLKIPRQNLHDFTNEETEAREIKIFSRSQVMHHSYSINAHLLVLKCSMAKSNSKHIFGSEESFYASEKILQTVAF